MMGFGLIPLRHRIEIAQATLRMQAIGRDGRDQFADVSFGRVLREMGQSPDTIAGFWDVICVSALNEPCTSAAGHYGLQVFQEAFLGERGGYRLGFARVSLSTLYRQLPVQTLLQTSVKSLIVEGGRVCGVRLSDRELRADRIILAVSPWSAAGLLTAEMLAADPQLAGIRQLQPRAIIGAHIQFDRAILDVPNLALMGTRLHWAFADVDDPTLIHGVASAADDLCPLPQQVIVDLLVQELRQACPAARAATLRQFVIVKETRATFRPLSGVDAFRPTQQTRIPGLTLAGDYTQTTWPSTMEGAVRSGRLAARAAERATAAEAHFRSWIGAGLKAPLASNRRFKTEDDL
jgi:zeta-carotene desaturase